MNESAVIRIGGREIGPGRPAYVIAEMSANHHGDLARAKELVRAAKAAGADAIKLQTFSADAHTIDCDRECFRIRGGTLWDGETLYGLYRRAAMPWEWQPELTKVADGAGIHLFSAPVDRASADFLAEMGVPAYKISSFELVDLPLIRHVAAKGKPLLLSTGMATLGEIEEAVTAAREAGAEEIALLRCNSSYPAPARDMNLRTIPQLASLFGVPVGLSDHTIGDVAAVAAVALGAALIEKHFTLSRDLPGPDSAFSAEPGELAALVRSLRAAEEALGAVKFGPTPAEESSLAFRRSLFVVARIRQGEPFTEANVRAIRPGHGLSPKYLNEVLGKRAAADVERGTPLSWALVGPG